MPSTKGYYVKPLGRTSIPRVIIGVQCVTVPCDDVPQTAYRRESELSYVVTSHSLWSWTGWSPIQTIAHRSADAFWEWLESDSWNRKRIHLFAPHATSALTLLRCWDRLESVGISPSPPSVSSVRDVSAPGPIQMYQLHANIQTQRTTIFDYSRLGIRYIWASLSQFLPLSIDEIREMVESGDKSNDTKGQVQVPVREQVQAESYLTVCAMQYFAAWWKAHKGGPWSNSIGALAARFLRSRLQPRTLCTHRHADALSLERAACFGGRVSCWYVGDVAVSCGVSLVKTDRPPRTSYGPLSGPVYSVDVASMYPHLLATKVYPVKLIGYERQMSLADLDCLLRYVCVIARVTLDTNEAEYPFRSSDSVYYPTGQFTTVLCGPELSYALRHNHIVQVHSASIYECGTPFVGSATSLLAARAACPAGSRSPSARVVKLLSNAISGTLAQRQTRWIPCPTTRPPCDSVGRDIRWGPFITTRADPSWVPESDPRYAMMTGNVEQYRPRLIQRYRVIAGMVERLERSEVGTGTLQACYAYLTSYGRSMMRDLRRICPDKSVLLQDTDGLWISESGHDALASHAGTYGTLPGEVRIDRRIQLARVYGPKHYWADGVWTLSGFHDPVYDSDNHTVTDTRAANPLLGTPTEAPHTVVEWTRHSELLLQHMHGHQGDDGWITPYHLSEGVKPRRADHPHSDESR